MDLWQSRYLPLTPILGSLISPSQFSEVANVTYPDIYRWLLNGLDLMNFDFGWILSTGCIVDVDFHDRLVISTTGPLIAMSILGATYFIAMHRNRDSESALENVRRKHLSMVVLVTFLVYSPFSSVLFQMFACERLDDDNTYLRADYRIKCDSSKHQALQIFSGLMILLYPVGILLFYVSLLFRRRAVLMDKDRRRIDPFVMSYSNLWKPYKCDRYFFEVVECIRRILSAGIVVFIYPNTAAQIAIALLIAIFFAVATEIVAPYSSRWDTWIARAGHAIVFASMYVALLMRVNVSTERASSQKLFDTILVCAQVAIVLTLLVEVVAMSCSVRPEQEDRAGPRVPPAGVLSFE